MTKDSEESEYEIKKPTEHWTEVPHEATNNRHASKFKKANRKLLKRLMKRWSSSKSEYGFFLDYEDRLQMGPMIAEGEQAKIYSATFEDDNKDFVLKVFKKDISLADLECLWPPPMLPLLRDDYEPQWMKDEPHCCWVQGGTVLKDGRFAFLMDKYCGDLRKYIDGEMEQKNYHGSPFFPLMYSKSC